MKTNRTAVTLLFTILSFFTLASKARNPINQGRPFPAWYKCNTDNCQPPSCFCAQTSSPGKIQAQEVPQLIVINFEGHLNAKTSTSMHQLTSDITHRNGCPLPITWFLSLPTDNNDPDVITQRWQTGDEIAIHGSEYNTTAYSSVKDLLNSITSFKQWIEEQSNIPSDHIVGYRAGYFGGSPMVRRYIYNNGFLYDSSLVEPVKDHARRLWPYTMDQGIPQNQAKKAEKYMGMWEVPLYQITYKGHKYIADVGMEYTTSYMNDSSSSSSDGVEERKKIELTGDPYDMLQANFEAVYSGNRAPLLLYLHEEWFEMDNAIERAKKFITGVLKENDVYFVTAHQLIEWMKQPKPSREMDQWYRRFCGGSLSNMAETTLMQIQADEIDSSGGGGGGGGGDSTRDSVDDKDENDTSNSSDGSGGVVEEDRIIMDERRWYSSSDGVGSGGWFVKAVAVCLGIGMVVAGSRRIMMRRPIHHSRGGLPVMAASRR